MYKIILIDDNSAFLDAFHKIIDWKKYNFEVVGCFYDGATALKFIENNYIDAVITDIRMPMVSGIDLARTIKEKYMGVKVVFFSAFCNFKYAAEAIKYDVVGYISKPISRTQTYEVLDKLRDILDEKTADNLSEIVDSPIISAREEVFSKWIGMKKVYSDFLREDLAKVNILYQTVYLPCAVAIFDFESLDEQLENKWKHDKGNLYDALTKVVCVDSVDYYTVLLGITDVKLAVLYISKSKRYTELPKRFAIVASEELKNIFEVKITNINFFNFESMNDFKDTVNSTGIPELKAVLKLLASKHDRELLSEAEKYINEHYMESIDLESVAKHCHFNHQRFSKMFKEIKGEKFLTYLNRVRIRKAQEMLLENPDDDIDMICKKVGYASKWYFYKQFSHYTGETPAQYRKKMMEMK